MFPFDDIIMVWHAVHSCDTTIDISMNIIDIYGDEWYLFAYQSKNGFVQLIAITVTS